MEFNSSFKSDVVICSHLIALQLLARSFWYCGGHPVCLIGELTIESRKEIIPLIRSGREW